MNVDELTNDQRYFLSYDQFQIHELMLRDRPRVAAYHDAIMNNKTLFENKVVLDVGSGTGILSMFAAKAGARLVYAVDACPTICNLAKELIRTNHFEDRIRVINKRIEEIDKFDENIDIIISEWMGFYLLHESMLESVIYARDHFLPKTSIESIQIFPSHAYLYCAPFLDQKIRNESTDMWKNYFDLNLTPIVRQIKNSDLTECVIETIESSQLVHDAQLIHSFDLRTVQAEDLHSLQSFCQFEIENSCIISGFAFWFDCYFSSNTNSSLTRTICLQTGPENPSTHWKQTLVFLPEDIYPLKGQIVPVKIQMKQSDENRRQYNLTIAIDDTEESPTAMRKRQHQGSSESQEDEDDEEEEEEHPMPCSCDRPKCKLIKAIMEKFDHEEEEEEEDGE